MLNLTIIIMRDYYHIFVFVYRIWKISSGLLEKLLLQKLIRRELEKG